MIETPYVVDLIAAGRVRHDLPRARLLLLAHRGQALAARHGLVVADVERLAIHGGSLRIHLRHTAAAEPSAAVTGLLAEEATLGVAGTGYYADFVDRVEQLKQATVALVRRLHDEGSRLAAYGAAAKGAVLLNHFGIDHELIDVVVDRNHHKHGLIMPGVGIPIADTARLVEDRPDHVLLLAWNFADEIIGQQQEYLDLGGAFIVPIPELRVVER